MTYTMHGWADYLEQVQARLPLFPEQLVENKWLCHWNTDTATRWHHDSEAQLAQTAQQVIDNFAQDMHQRYPQHSLPTTRQRFEVLIEGEL